MPKDRNLSSWEQFYNYLSQKTPKNLKVSLKKLKNETGLNLPVIYKNIMRHFGYNNQDEMRNDKNITIASYWKVMVAQYLSDIKNNKQGDTNARPK